MRLPSACFLFLGALVAPVLAVKAQPAADSATLYLGWRAEPEFGGFFQALNAGIYKKYGLDAHIVIGNPQTSAGVILALHKADFIEGSTGDEVNYLAQGIPVEAVAAIFQESPRVLIAHPGQGIDSLESMRGKPVLVGAQGLATVWPFLRVRYGFDDGQVRPYTFNEAPFLRDPHLIQEGYVTEEPYILKTMGLANPVIVRLSEHGYSEYAMALITHTETVRRRPDYVQRFVNATIEGWYGYLFGNPEAGNRFIHENNPDITDEQIAYARQTMKDLGLVASGAAKTQGIGAMTDGRWADFYKTLVESKIAPAGLDIRSAYTLQFVNQKVGL